MPLSVLPQLVPLKACVHFVLLACLLQAPGSVVGTCRLSLKETGEDYRDAKAEDAFCGSGSYSYISPSGTNYTYPQHNCRYQVQQYSRHTTTCPPPPAAQHAHPHLAGCRVLQDEYDAQFPSLESDAIFMTTRVTQTDQRLPDDCLVGGTTEACQYHNVSSEVYFVANAAYFTVRTHTAIACTSLFHRHQPNALTPHHTTPPAACGPHHECAQVQHVSHLA